MKFHAIRSFLILKSLEMAEHLWWLGVILLVYGRRQEPSSKLFQNQYIDGFRVIRLSVILYAVCHKILIDTLC